MIISSLTLLLLFSALYIIGLSYLYFSKSRIKNGENKIYKILLLSNLLGLILQLLCDFASYKYDAVSPIISDIIFKTYLIYFIIWVSLIIFYLIEVTFKNKKFFNIITILLILILSIIVIFLPYELYRNVSDKIYYTYGFATMYTFIISGLLSFIILLILIIKRKKISSKKSLPIYLFLFLGLFTMFIQMLKPELVITTAMESLICCLMYFTIENPDLKMMEELYKNKTLVEKTYEDKSNFLFEMTQEVREPLFKINNLCKEVDREEDKKTIKEGVKLISTSVKQLDFIVNDVLDVTSLDVQKVRTINTNYNINNLYEDIVTRMNSIIPKNIEFRHSIISTSKYLYGDNIKLKQIIMSILMNSIKKTEKGYIEFSIDTIERYDVVRLVVKIIDSGSGMSIDKINDILEATGELSQTDIENMEKMDLNLQLCQKIIKLLGGNLMIKSGEEKGTEVILTIDQKVKQTEETSVLTKYESYVNKTDSILIVSQNKKLVEDIKDKLKDKELNITTSLFGKDAIDKVRSGKKYKVILMDDEMKDINGYTTFKELESIEKFKTPVVIMLDKLKDKIKEEYIKDGFNNYLLIENFNEEIEKIINKYII